MELKPKRKRIARKKPTLVFSTSRFVKPHPRIDNNIKTTYKETI